MEFHGATDWWSYQGLFDSYYESDINPFERVWDIPFPHTELGEECQNCYLLGFFLGNEIKGLTP